MGVLIGFAVGYWMGTRAGRDAVQELVASAQEISQSREFEALQRNALSFASDLARQTVAGARSAATDRQADGSLLAAALAAQARDLLTRRLAA